MDAFPDLPKGPPLAGKQGSFFLRPSSPPLRNRFLIGFQRFSKKNDRAFQYLHPKNLSRAIEDAGTVTSVLIPWNSGGAYNAGVLGVPTLTYLPFCFFNLLSPLVSLFLASMNWTIEKIGEEKKELEIDGKVEPLKA